MEDKILAVVEATNWEKELEENNWRVLKHTSLIEFYYIALSLEKAEDLIKFKAVNSWYFGKMHPRAKQQINVYLFELKRKEALKKFG